jgi:hypothetical protein
MVNIIIYLKKEHDAKELVKHLLTTKLIASASIDENNISYQLLENKFSSETFNVITAQSKAILFLEVVKEVETKIGEETLINSTPIVGSNRTFDTSVRTKTINFNLPANPETTAAQEINAANLSSEAIKE